ncbi:MAG: hypothetical protein AAB225_04445, partial [Acidobacteriota bacterium]
GRQRRVAGIGRDDPLSLLSGFLEWARPEATSQYCREFYWSGIQKSLMRLKLVGQVEMWERGDMAAADYLLSTAVQEKTLYQKHLWIFLARDGTCAWLHVSKGLQKPPAPLDEILFASFIAGTRVMGVDGTRLWPPPNPALRSYSIPDRGRIELAVPPSWVEAVRQPPGGLPPTIAFWTDNDVLIFATVFWDPEGNPRFNSPDRLRSLVDLRVRQVKDRVVEKKLAIEELRGPETRGYLIRTTDRAPKPGEWKAMTQGHLGVGQLMLTFSVFSDDKAAPDLQASIDVLKNARLKP